ncbi:hypothetical protein FHV95_10148 [Streptomyces coelicolor]|nr:hypothetical protein FHV91_101806 [Streptomyces coelicolor]TYP18287.1 hypothetical protein FHV98_10149 [Streptomyces coelicolor A3(2)]TYP31283.1 hypothetical protein FHV94_10949 [Streptomyces coelicolor]TYP37671.1 hypothetical protein FHV92_108228 [Streptomyces coelicolor]TYP59054.1 hypothetical protein FHV95_10148 [Streptomyces coelicolor]
MGPAAGVGGDGAGHGAVGRRGGAPRAGWGRRGAPPGRCRDAVGSAAGVDGDGAGRGALGRRGGASRAGWGRCGAPPGRRGDATRSHARCGGNAVGPATGVGGDGVGSGAVGPPTEARPEPGGDVAGHRQDVAGMRWGRRRGSMVTERGAARWAAGEARPEPGGDVAGHRQEVAGMRWGPGRESVVTGRGAVGPPGERAPSRVGTSRDAARTSRGTARTSPDTARTSPGRGGVRGEDADAVAARRRCAGRRGEDAVGSVGVVRSVNSGAVCVPLRVDCLAGAGIGACRRERRTGPWQGQGRPWARPAGSWSRSVPPR